MKNKKKRMGLFWKLQETKSYVGSIGLLISCFLVILLGGCISHSSGVIRAVTSGDLQYVRSYLQKGGDPNAIDTSGWSPRPILWVAVFKSHNEIAKALIDNGANVNQPGLVGAGTMPIYPIHVAVKNRNYEMVTYLLENGANPNASSDWAPPPLYSAITNSDLQLVRMLLKRGSSPRIMYKSPHPSDNL